MRPLACLFALILAGPALAETPTPVGDGGSVGLTLRNQSVHPMPIRLGSTAGDGPTITLERYAEGGFLAQCGADSRGVVPALRLDVDRRGADLDVPPTSFPDGAPVLWITSARTGRAALAAVVERSMPGAMVQALDLQAVPTTFAGLRFARMIVIAAADFGRLDTHRKRALADAVSAGVTLVVDTGEAGAAPDVLRRLAPITLGEVGRPAGALLSHLPRASAQRALKPSGGAQAILTANGDPIIVEAPRGLGRIRVLGIRLADLSAGKVAEAAFRPAEAPLAHVLNWLAQAPPPGETRASPFGAHVWFLLLGLLAIVVVTRRRPRATFALVVPWWLIALIVPPQWGETRLDAARVLYVPVADGALAVGTLDLTLTRGGARSLETPGTRTALEDARPGGACLVVGDDESAWVVDGQPGSPRRITFFALMDAMPVGADKLGSLPTWPGGALAGATLRRVSDGDLPISMSPDRLDAVRVEPLPPATITPEALQRR